MSRDKDYEKMMELVRTYIKLGDTRKDAAVVMFYAHVEGMFLYEGLGKNYEQASSMRDARTRFINGRGDVGEARKYFDYFGRKFSGTIASEKKFNGDKGVREAWRYS